jgi:transcriptional regulator with XRE-family HTH domain
MSLTQYRNLKNAIIQLLREHDWTQGDLAREMGTKQPVISAWVSGSSWPNEQNRKLLAKLRGETSEQFENYLKGLEPDARETPDTAAEAWPFVKDLDKDEKVILIKQMLDSL